MILLSPIRATCLTHLIFIDVVTRTMLGEQYIYEGWNFNSGNYLFTTDTK